MAEDGQRCSGTDPALREAAKDIFVLPPSWNTRFSLIRITVCFYLVPATILYFITSYSIPSALLKGSFQPDSRHIGFRTNRSFTISSSRWQPLTHLRQHFPPLISAACNLHLHFIPNCPCF